MLPCSYYFDRVFWGTLWVLAHIGLFTWAYCAERFGTDNIKNKEILGEYLYIARAAAKCLNFDMAVILLPVCRTVLSYSKRIPLIGRLVPFDKHIRFHMIIAWTMAVFTAVHVTVHYGNFRLLQLADPQKYNAMKLSWDSWAGITGQIMTFILLLLVTTGMHSVKKQLFELFWYIHHLFWLFFACAVLHSHGCILKTDSGVCYEKTTWKWVLLGLSLYVIEIIARWIRAFQRTTIRKIVWHPSKTFEVQFDKTAMFVKAGEYVHINVPEISHVQWHPFTLTSCQQEGYHSVHIRVVGDWTVKFAQMVGCMTQDEKWVVPQKIDYSKLPRLRIDGPFGTPSETAFKYEVCLMIGGGIGVTPFASLLKQIWYTVQQPGYKMKLRKVHFVWIARSTESFEWFRDLLAHLEGENFDQFIDIQIYLTGKLKQNDAANVVVNDGVEGQDAITKLRSRTNFGRPNIPGLFSKIKDNHHAESRLHCGVFFCGPARLAHTLRIESHKQTDNYVKYHFKKEIF